ncbi:MAG: hypothetical protein CMA40_00140, partial [Euryarchaeota archaeon]|nr:hypothetical protein [Euryarchaeota archaeon]
MKSLSQVWYTPQEITTLRLWLAVAFVINLVLSSIEWIRGDFLALQLSLLGAFALAVLWLVLPDGEDSWKRDAAMAKSGLVL